ncbi:MAG TPA: hypothetical protein VH437_22165 [Terriglobales bacterium]|jgi:hypothetical protein
MDDEGIKQLTQDKVPDPLVRQQLDDITLSLLRPEKWQVLHFADVTSRSPVSSKLEPVLQLVEALGHERHTQLDEDTSRNNCLPPGEIALKHRGENVSDTSQNARLPIPNNSRTAPVSDTLGIKTAMPAAPFVFRLFENEVDERHVAKACIVVYGDGKFHREKKEQTPGKNDLKANVYEGAVEDSSISQLNSILRDPKLWEKVRRDPPTGTVIRTGKVGVLTVVSDGKTKTVSLWKYLGAFRIGPAAQPDYQDNGIKLLKPLEEWVKKNTDDRHLTPQPDLKTSNCQL